MAQWVKDLALSLLWRGFDPWPGNFRIPWAWPKQTNKQKNLLIKKIKKKKRGSSSFGTAEMNLTSIHEDQGLIPGPAQ